jgi:hypothetical protein
VPSTFAPLDLFCFGEIVFGLLHLQFEKQSPL